jgi:hypothetical protein
MSSTDPTPARTPRLEQAITNPGSVKINVKGAFIVDDDPRSKSPVRTDGVHYEGHDIRLPHHTGVVSHVAVDVSFPEIFLVSVVPRTLLSPRNRLFADRHKASCVTDD